MIRLSLENVGIYRLVKIKAFKQLNVTKQRHFCCMHIIKMHKRWTNTEVCHHHRVSKIPGDLLSKTKVQRAPGGLIWLYLDQEKEGCDEPITGCRFNNLSRRMTLQLKICKRNQNPELMEC